MSIELHNEKKAFIHAFHDSNKKYKHDSVRRYAAYNKPIMAGKFLKEVKNSKGSLSLMECVIYIGAYKKDDYISAMINQMALLEKAIFYNIQFMKGEEFRDIEKEKPFLFMKNSSNYNRFSLQHTRVDGNPPYIKMAALSMLNEDEYSNIGMLKKLLNEAEHIKNFPGLDKHQKLFTQLVEYSRIAAHNIVQQPHFLNSMFEKFVSIDNEHSTENGASIN